MKLPLKCPWCNSIMLTDFSYQNILIRSCEKNPSHVLWFGADEHDDVITIRFIYNSGRETAIWRYASRHVEIVSNVTSDLMEKSAMLPFFEPDFSQSSVALIKKLQLYTAML